MKLWFNNTLAFFFVVTVVLEFIGIFMNYGTISDLVLTNIRMRWRVAILAWLAYHFIFEYPQYR